MRIAVTSNTFNAGGAEVQRIYLANSLAAMGHTVTLVALQSGGALLDRIENGVRVVIGRPLRSLKSRFDVVIGGTTNTEVFWCTAASLMGARWLIAVHNPVGKSAPRVSNYVAMSTRAADAVVALSAGHAKGLKTWGIEPDSIVGNAVALTAPEEIERARTQSRQFKYTAGYVGRLSQHHKGLDRLLEAVASPAFEGRVLIAGEGPDGPALREYADALGLADKIDWVGHAEVSSVFPIVRALVLLSRFEGQPVIALEAAAARVPMFVSREVQDSVPSGTEVVDADQPDAVARAIAGCTGIRAISEVPPAPLGAAQQYSALAEEVMGRRPRASAMRRVGILCGAGWRR